MGARRKSGDYTFLHDERDQTNSSQCRGCDDYAAARARWLYAAGKCAEKRQLDWSEAAGNAEDRGQALGKKLGQELGQRLRKITCSCRCTRLHQAAVRSRLRTLAGRRSATAPRIDSA